MAATTAFHPGEILREEYLIPMGLKPYTLAKKLRVPRTRIERLVAEQTPVTPDTAVRLAKFFNTTPQFWMNMQAAFDLSAVGVALSGELDQIQALEPNEYAEARHAA
jgi:addiction module HigA family antidote